MFRRKRYAVDPETGSVTGYQTQNLTYDQANNVLRQEPSGAMEYQEFEYDSLGRRTKETDPLDHSRMFGYDDASNMISLVDQNEEVWTRGYDPIGRLIRSTNPLDESVTYGYDEADEQTTVTNALDETTTSTFDAAGRLVSVADPLNMVTSCTYDANGNRTSVTDPNDLTTEAEYDYLNRQVKVIDPAEHEMEFEYNLTDELIVATDAKGHDTIYQYDALGRRISTTDRLNETTTFTWNVLGRQESMTDAENQTTSYIYDGYGRLFQTIWPDHDPESEPGDEDYGITQTEYDDLNRVVRTMDQLGDTITFVYDNAGRMESRDYRTYANSPHGPIADSDTFMYDAVGRILSAEKGRYSNTVERTYDEVGRVKTESLTAHGETYMTSADYDEAGHLSKLIYPDGSIMERTMDVRGLLETITRNSAPVLAREYDDGGRLIEQTFGNGVVESLIWNDDGTVHSIDSPAGLLEYSYDQNMNRTAEQITGALSGASWTTGANGFDDDDRLIHRNQGSGTLEESWDLSPVGDWNEFTQDAVVQTRTHGQVHEIETITTSPTTVNIEHDPKGNVTVDDLGQILVWDFDNMLVSVDIDADTTPDVLYEYDALTRRVSRTDAFGTEIYVCWKNDVIIDYAAEAEPADPLRTYVMAQRIDDRIAMFPGTPPSSDDRESSGSESGGELALVYYYHADAVTSIRALTDGSGDAVEYYWYASYGEPTIMNDLVVPLTGSAVGNRYLFTARDLDEATRLYHFRSRPLSSSLGRFLAQDPLAYVDGPSLYNSYFIPNSIDPFGLQEPGPWTWYGPYPPSPPKPNTGAGSGPFARERHELTFVACGDCSKIQEDIYNSLTKFSHFNEGHNDIASVNIEEDIAYFDTLGWFWGTAVDLVPGNSDKVPVELTFYPGKFKVCGQTLGGHMLEGARYWQVKTRPSSEPGKCIVTIITAATERKVGDINEWGANRRGTAAQAKVWECYLRNIQDAYKGTDEKFRYKKIIPIGPPPPGDPPLQPPGTEDGGLWHWK